MTDPGPLGRRSGTGFGCLGTLLAVVTVTIVVVLALLVGFVALGIVAAIVVIGLLAYAVDRVLLALSPKRRDSRAAKGGVFIGRAGMSGSGPVIDASAIETTATEGPRSPGGPGRAGPEPDDGRPEGSGTG